MASSVQRISSNTSALRAALAPWSRPFSSDALVEVHPGEIGMVSGIPEEHLRRKVVIYSPVRTATQQGSGKVGRWKINFVSTKKWENPLMGWTSTGDPYANVGDAGFGFDSEEAAKSFAEKHGWEYVVKRRQTPLLKLERIADPSPKFLQTKMSSITTRFPTKSLTRFIELHRRPLCRSLCVAAETRTQRLERIADELLDLNKLERYDYAVLTRLRMGLNKYGAALSGLGQSAAPAGSAAGSANETKAAEKTAFDIKLDKFDASAKIKIIKEVRTFTDLGLKEAKDLVEKAPVVLKKGVTKEEADSIVAKLKELGATVVLE